jgi:hypothetical protein
MVTPRGHMRVRIESQNIRGKHVIADHVFDRCTFAVCHLCSEGANARPVLRRISVTNCKLDSVGAHGAIFEDCTVDGLKTNRLSMVTGCAFRSVVLRGDLGQFLIRASEPPGVDPIDDANLRYYEDVEWALDIRDARAVTLDIRDIPLHLIRRNPETQAIVKRARLPYAEMLRLGLGPTATQLLSTFFPEDPDRKLLVAGARSKTFGAWVEAFAQLRAAGLAE